MAKDGSKSKKSKKASSNLARQDKSKAQELPSIPLEPEPEDIRIISICVTNVEDIIPTYSPTDLHLQIQYKDKDILISEKFPCMDDNITSCFCDGKMQLNVLSRKEINDLLNNPICFTLFESQGVMDETLLPPKIPEIVVEEIVPPVTKQPHKKNDKKGDKGKKESKSTVSQSNQSKTSKVKDKEKKGKNKKKGESKFNLEVVDENIPPPTLVVGTGSLDLLPLFLGQNTFIQGVPLYQNLRYKEDKIISDGKLPRLHINVEISEPFTSPETLSDTNIMYLTVEAIYNLPSILKPELKYQVAAILPNDEKLQSEPQPLGKYTSAPLIGDYKKWASPYNKNDSNAFTRYKINKSKIDIRNDSTHRVNFDNILNNDLPRIEWNCITRKFVSEAGTKNLQNQLCDHGLWPIEFYFNIVEWIEDETQNENIKSRASSKGSKKGSKGSKKDSKSSSKKSKSSKSSKNKSSTEIPPVMKEISGDYFHLMALADFSNLLYPGVQKTRICCQLKTFQAMEAKETGLEQSYFVQPKPVTVEESCHDVPKKKKQKKGKKDKKDKKDKKSKSSKSSSETVKNSGKKKSKSESESKSKPDSDLKTDNQNDEIPAKVEPPSAFVYNDYGDPMIVIFEVELMRPLLKKRAFEDLSKDLSSAVPYKEPLNKALVECQDAENDYKRSINVISEDLQMQYINFMHLYSKQCGETPGVQDFVKFLQRQGVYSRYVSILVEAVTVLVEKKFIDHDKNRNKKTLQVYISKVHDYLVQRMNEIVNNTAMCGLSLKLSEKSGYLHLYGREMLELDASALARRYFMKRIVKVNRNPYLWIDYATCLLRLKEFSTALGCVTEALSLDSKNRYALLMYALMNAESQDLTEIETSMLMLHEFYPNWTEGWACHYLLYKINNDKIGCNVCWEKCKMCMELEDPNCDNLEDDLSWSASLAPDTFLYRTIILLLKLKLIKFANLALDIEAQSNEKTGIWYYYRGVSYYLAYDFNRALDRYVWAEELLGFNKIIYTSIGHCLMRSNKPIYAKKYYSAVLESTANYDNLHLLLINMAMLYEKFGENEKAKNALLHVCKSCPTPYTWQALGLLYLQDDDLIKSEICFCQSNVLDNRLVEPWKHLSIINARMNRNNESNFCAMEAKKCEARIRNLEPDLETLFYELKRNKHPKQFKSPHDIVL